MRCLEGREAQLELFIQMQAQLARDASDAE
jgi:hypothetical protein